MHSLSAHTQVLARVATRLISVLYDQNSILYRITRSPEWNSISIAPLKTELFNNTTVCNTEVSEVKINNKNVN